MEKKICLITGANAGIGKAAAIQLAQVGHHVILGCRNPQRGQQALESVRAESGSADVSLLVLDMASQTSIMNAAQQVLQDHSCLDVLIHNAAAFDISQKEKQLTPEGIESVWATNHIGPVLLTEALLPALKRSSQGRIIMITSKGLMMHPRLKVDLEDPEFSHRKFSVPAAYYQSKLAQVMYTYWLANELAATAITVNAIRVTNVKVDVSRYPDLGWLAKAAYSLKSRFSISPEEMAETYTFLATDPSLATVTGGYFDENQKQVSAGKYAASPSAQEQLMELTERYPRHTVQL
ncbi:MAG: SDR family NAD(P)-dependent oxidoreductase [Bacteroidota bacterium]